MMLSVLQPVCCTQISVLFPLKLCLVWRKTTGQLKTDIFIQKCDDILRLPTQMHRCKTVQTKIPWYSIIIMFSGNSGCRSPYHSWAPQRWVLLPICPAGGWGSHRWQQPGHSPTQRTALVGQPATAAHSHSLMHWNPVAWIHRQHAQTHEHTASERWACSPNMKHTVNDT